MNFIDLKERIAVGEALTPDQRNFVLDCINQATEPVVDVEVSPPNYLGRIDQIWAFLSGSACAAHAGTTKGVRNIMMLNQRAPTPGKGWACVVCNLVDEGGRDDRHIRC